MTLSVVHNIRIETDSNTANVFEELNIKPYVLEIETEMGGALLTPITRDGTASIKLDNTGGLFNPHNTSSPFYTKLLPNRKIKIWLNDEVLWLGYIEYLKPELNVTRPTATLSCVQGIEYMKNIYLKNPVYQNKTAKGLVESLLLDNGWFSPNTESMFILDVGVLDEDTLTESALDRTNIQLDDTFIYPYASHTWTSETSLYDALQDVLEAELGFMFMTRDGVLTAVPSIHASIATPARTVVLRDEAEDGSFTSELEIYNVVKATYREPVITPNDTFEFSITSNPEPTTSTYKLSGGEGVDKKVLLGTPSIAHDGATTTAYINDIGTDYITFYHYSTVADENATITITVNTMGVADGAEVKKQNDASVELYRRVYERDVTTPLLYSANVANRLIDSVLIRHALPFNYIEQYETTDVYDLSVGDVVVLDTKEIIPTNQHIITGERITLIGTVVQTSYRLYGQGGITPFILNTSLLDSSSVIL